MEEIISLRFKYTEEEYVSATRFYLFRTSDFLFQPLVIALIMAVVFLIQPFDLQSVLTFFLIFASIIWLCVWLFVLFLMPRQRFRSDPKFRDEYFLQFSDDGIQFKTTQIDALLQWSLYNKVLENERFYILVYGKNMISVIPKRAFASAHEDAVFKEMLRRNLPAYANSKRLKEHESDVMEQPYVPPTKPPDWR